MLENDRDYAGYQPYLIKKSRSVWDKWLQEYLDTTRYISYSRRAWVKGLIEDYNAQVVLPLDN